MPISHSVDHARHRMDTVAVGQVTYAETLAHLEMERRAGGLPYPELIDLTGGELAFTPAEIRRLVEDLRRLGTAGDLGPTAVVVSSEFTFGMLRMLETLVEDVCRVRPFREWGEAERWLAQQSGESSPREQG